MDPNFDTIGPPDPIILAMAERIQDIRLADVPQYDESTSIDDYLNRLELFLEVNDKIVGEGAKAAENDVRARQALRIIKVGLTGDPGIWLRQRVNLAQIAAINVAQYDNILQDLRNQFIPVNSGTSQSGLV